MVSLFDQFQHSDGVGSCAGGGHDAHTHGMVVRQTTLGLVQLGA